MTSLRLIETDDAPVAEDTTSQLAEDATSHLFETPRPGGRYRRSRWPYDISVVLHATALVVVVILPRYLTQPPPLPPTPASPLRDVTSAFILTEFNVNTIRPRRSSVIRHPKPLPVATVRRVAAAPAPAAVVEPRVADASPIADEKPLPSVAFGPAIPAGDARVTGRRGDPTEAGLGNATANVRGSPTAEVRPGGLGDGSSRRVGNGGSAFSVRPGFDDGSEGGGGATPPRIQGPLPIPDYPADARAHRLQGVVVLEVMLEALGQARVRRVLSHPLGFGIEEAARSAAERLKFTPARQGGRSVDAIVQVRVTFTLTEGVATAVMGGA